ncbi:HD domain-containing protein [Dactylosporangium cerinum]|uniref:HD domain-containing protein n=1 Tax=Dactylosporangium cerinum TaxID=1434730 RepID=A0ABV9W2H8_9ACTN
MPQRQRHSAGVAHRAAELRDAVDLADLDIVLAAAWLHDIGYAADLHDTGFHPLDGARFLARAGWPARICALVAHHSGARYVASVRGLGRELGEFSPRSIPGGRRLDVRRPDGRPGRHPHGCGFQDGRHAAPARPDSDNARVHQLRATDLLAIAQRVEHRLRGCIGPGR